MSDQTLHMDGRASIYSDINTSEMLPWLLRLTDFAICMFGFIALPLLFGYGIYNIVYDMQSYLSFGFVFGLFFVFYSEINGLYKKKNFFDMPFQFKGICASWFFAWMFFILTAFALKASTDFSRLLIATMMATGAPILILARLSFRHWLVHAHVKGFIRKENALLITIGNVIFSQDQLKKRFFVNGSLNFHPENLLEAPETLLHSLADSRLERVIIAIPFEQMNLLPRLVQVLRHSPLPIYVITDAWFATVIPGFTEHVGANIIGNATIFELSKPPMSVIERMVKRGFDSLFAGVALVLLSPVMVVTAIAVKIDSAGPVFFRQKRLGFNNREFSILKFRSMTVMEDGATITQAKRGDQRITRVGKIIRATSLDELPQLLNVLAGQMSIVGPRPHALAHDQYYGDMISEYSRRRHMKPGLTGWAQVHGFRGETPDIRLMEARVEHDLWYIQNWSLWLDFWIVLRTIRELLRNRNVY